MGGFVDVTPREPDGTEPPPANAAVGKLPKNERPSTLPRGKGGVHMYVAAYPNWGRKEKNSGTEQFRYLVRTMCEVEQLLKSGEKTVADFKAQVRGWQRLVNDQGA
eukprot:2640232-Prymnesium_polylepis.1